MADAWSMGAAAETAPVGACPARLLSRSEYPLTRVETHRRRARDGVRRARRVQGQVRARRSSRQLRDDAEKTTRCWRTGS